MTTELDEFADFLNEGDYDLDSEPGALLDEPFLAERAAPKTARPHTITTPMGSELVFDDELEAVTLIMSRADIDLVLACSRDTVRPPPMAETSL